ncbi:MAG: hypothetical protein ACOC7S_00740 [Planctomycetota bacterium]
MPGTGKWSVVVTAGNRYELKSGDWTHWHNDGMKRVQCVSVHESSEGAQKALARYRRQDAAEDLAESYEE